MRIFLVGAVLREERATLCTKKGNDGLQKKVKVAQGCLTLFHPMDCTVHGILQGQNTGVGSHSLLQRIFPAQSEPISPALQADSLRSEPPGKPKNTGVGSLSLLLGIFLTQELNQRPFHCKWILYQLSYQ